MRWQYSPMSVGNLTLISLASSVCSLKSRSIPCFCGHRLGIKLYALDEVLAALNQGL